MTNVCCARSALGLTGRAFLSIVRAGFEASPHYTCPRQQSMEGGCRVLTKPHGLRLPERTPYGMCIAYAGSQAPDESGGQHEQRRAECNVQVAPKLGGPELSARRGLLHTVHPKSTSLSFILQDAGGEQHIDCPTKPSHNTGLLLKGTCNELPSSARAPWLT